MTNDQTNKFLAQFEASRKEVAEWPEWMKNAANVASVSFPESKAENNIGTERRADTKS